MHARTTARDAEQIGSPNPCLLWRLRDRCVEISDTLAHAEMYDVPMSIMDEAWSTCTGADRAVRADHIIESSPILVTTRGYVSL